jgi:hypothetical protein
MSLGETYLLRSADLQDITRLGAKSGFTADHIGAIAQHQDTDERVAVSMPSDNRLIILPRATSNTLIICEEALLLGDGSKFLLGNFLRLGRKIDVANLKVASRNQIDAGNFRESLESLRALPGIVDERCIPGVVSQ